MNVTNDNEATILRYLELNEVWLDLKEGSAIRDELPCVFVVQLLLRLEARDHRLDRLRGDGLWDMRAFVLGSNNKTLLVFLSR